MRLGLTHEDEELEPSGLGNDLLVEWAPWARDDAEDRHSWSVKPRVDHGYHGDPPDNFWITDKIVAPHRRDKSVYWLIVSRWYLGEKSYAQITLDLGRHWPEKRIRLNLVSFCELVQREFLDIREVDRARMRAAECKPRSPVVFVG